MPRFESVEDVDRWISKKTRQYGGRNEFLASDEYRRAYPMILKAWEATRSGYSAEAQRAMMEAGQKVGDIVEYDAMGPWHRVSHCVGRIVMERGIPVVRIIRGESSPGCKPKMRWHKGWRRKEDTGENGEEERQRILDQSLTDQGKKLIAEVPKIVEPTLEYDVVLTDDKVIKTPHPGFEYKVRIDAMVLKELGELAPETVYDERRNRLIQEAVRGRFASEQELDEVTELVKEKGWVARGLLPQDVIVTPEGRYKVVDVGNFERLGNPSSGGNGKQGIWGEIRRGSENISYPAVIKDLKSWGVYDYPNSFCHGTSSKLLPLIRQQGLVPRGVSPGIYKGKFKSKADQVYLGQMYEDQESSAPCVEAAREAARRFGGEPLILEVVLPKELHDKLEPDEDYERERGTEWAVKQCIQEEESDELADEDLENYCWDMPAWQKSLKYWGSLAVRGRIPPECIKASRPV